MKLEWESLVIHLKLPQTKNVGFHFFFCIIKKLIISEAVPGKVASLTTTATGPETIDIRWSPPSGGQPALRYKIFYSHDPLEKNEKETLITVLFHVSIHFYTRFYD